MPVRDNNTNNTVHHITDSSLESYDILKFLYDNDALTFEGLAHESIDEVIEFLNSRSHINGQIEAYVIKGKVMNDICGLTNDNAYPDDLTIIAFYPSGTVLAIQVGARWMSDIIDNNAVREDFHPFIDEEESEDEDLLNEIRDELEDDEAWGDSEWDEYENDDWDIDEFDSSYDTINKYYGGKNLLDETNHNLLDDYTESTQVSDVSVGEIYDYLKTKTLVKDATLEDILKDKEATAWEYAFQKAKEKNNGYDEEEFLNVYSKVLKIVNKEKQS